MVVLILFLFFFFQAEDGIRDLTVTGVQTCALPILLIGKRRQEPCRAAFLTGPLVNGGQGPVRQHDPAADVFAVIALRVGAPPDVRSEERRGGEEGRTRGAPYH